MAVPKRRQANGLRLCVVGLSSRKVLLLSGVLLVVWCSSIQVYQARLHFLLRNADDARDLSTTFQLSYEELNKQRNISTSHISSTSTTATSEARDTNATICDSFQFAVSGFAKCGTSSLTHWLESHPEIAIPPRELHMMSKSPQEVADLIQKRERRHRAQQKKGLQSKQIKSTTIDQNAPFIRGYWYPHDIQRSKVLDFYRNSCPRTKHIVSVRHPLLWFESMYNYRVTGGETWAIRHEDPNQLWGSTCNGDLAMACVDNGAFHQFLATLGKTPMRSKDELSLLGPSSSSTGSPSKRPAFQNPIFLVEIRQLSEASKLPGGGQLGADIQSFLGLQEPLHSVPHSNLGSQNHASTPEGVVESTKYATVDICSESLSMVHGRLLEVSRNASIWIRDYFLQSPSVYTSSRETFELLVKDWMKDPCLERRVSDM